MSFDSTAIVFGIDLAWGLKSADAIAQIELSEESLHIGSLSYTHGDSPLLQHIIAQQTTAEKERVLLAIDAPLQCLNQTGSRPVDKECNTLYRAYEAGCHPVNLNLCPRPIELASKLERAGFHLSPDLQYKKSAIEVYPHPAMIHWFRLSQTIKYKRGKVADKRKAFVFYQQCFYQWIRELYPSAELHSDLQRVLTEPWTKSNEDGLDAYLCAFIGAWHVQHMSQRSQVLGDQDSGFMVIPQRGEIMP